MGLGKISLSVAAASFVVYGLAFLSGPAWAGSFVGLELPAASARIDARATYGGFFLGTAVFWAMCARRAEWVRAGLASLALVMGGFALARVLGIAVDGGANAAIYALLGGEIAGLVLALLAIKRQASDTGRG